MWHGRLSIYHIYFICQYSYYPHIFLTEWTKNSLIVMFLKLLRSSKMVFVSHGRDKQTTWNYHSTQYFQMYLSIITAIWLDNELIKLIFRNLSSVLPLQYNFFLTYFISLTCYFHIYLEWMSIDRTLFVCRILFNIIFYLLVCLFLLWLDIELCDLNYLLFYIFSF